ncbi:MAG TPA: hypothetical protein VHL80_11160 [Polyangia bacterium]|nr:hypothetical protein [Polyangia bacterium]
MTKNQTVRLLIVGGLAAVISCDGAQSRTAGGLDVNDCPFGTFRPAGLDACVFPAVDVNNLTILVSDNRCAFNQPATPPSCVSDQGLRPYLALGPTCAPGYRFEDGACDRNGGVAGFATGTGGFFEGTGTAGATGIAGFFGDAGASGGFFDQCEAFGGCSGFSTGGGGSFGQAGDNAGTGVAGAGGASGTGGASGNDGGISGTGG